MPVINESEILHNRIAELERQISDDELLTVPHVADALHMSEEYVREQIRRGVLVGYKIGMWRVKRGDLRRYVESKRCV